MNKLRTLVIDDEALARDLLCAHLSKHSQIEVIGECRNGQQAIADIHKLHPDLIFLDVQMPELNGLDVIKRLPAGKLPLVVFVTAYDQFALKAFDVNAVDYILKPIDAETVQRAVARSIDRHAALGPSSTGSSGPLLKPVQSTEQKSALAVSTSIASASALREKLVIKDRNKISLIPHHAIDWVSAAGDYMSIHAQGETHLLRCTMRALLHKLNDPCFQRVHRSTIVNMHRIEHVIPHTKGEYFVNLVGGVQLKVSRNYRNVIKSFLTQLDSPAGSDIGVDAMELNN